MVSEGKLDDTEEVAGVTFMCGGDEMRSGEH